MRRKGTTGLRRTDLPNPQAPLLEGWWWRGVRGGEEGWYMKDHKDQADLFKLKSAPVIRVSNSLVVIVSGTGKVHASSPVVTN